MSLCQPDAELRPWQIFMALLKEKQEYLDLFTFKAILKVKIQFAEPSCPGAAFPLHIEKESPYFPLFWSSGKSSLYRSLMTSGMWELRRDVPFPYVFRPFIYWRMPAGLLYAEGWNRLLKSHCRDSERSLGTWSSFCSAFNSCFSLMGFLHLIIQQIKYWPWGKELLFYTKT